MLPHRSALRVFLAIAIPLAVSDSVEGQTANERIAEAVDGLELRSIGPALMGGRISDIAVHPTKRSTWYVAAGSGGVWKTTNAGISWTPVFEDQSSYSIGSVAIDPSTPNVVWVGTGENVSGRHVGWGDGVYRSLDGGQNWLRMGLESSEHIGKVLIDPRDGNVVFVASEGPLWSAGGDRGLFKTTDGGQTWVAVLEIDANTGVTDVEFDPQNPDVMYAASYERRRTVWSLLAGGPGSGIHKSTDGGETWRRIDVGLPKADMGKIGLDVSEADPNVVYATIEAAEEERGFYRSLDRGESWEKRNSYTSGGTGPHYYQEIEASPQQVDLVYQMDVFLNVTRNGGEEFSVLGTGREKHSDNHALWIDPDDGRHLLAGTDAGLYETFDEGDTWRHFPNLPLSQFYKLDLDNTEPFYNIIGGAQDLGTLIGPARTSNVEGVRNRDWYAPLGADGYATVFDPTDANVAYLQSQQGNLQRLDRSNNELIGIRPLPEPGEPPERWNWDAPVIVSPHSPTRVYYASQRLWRSDDRGDSWRAVSGDLTRNLNRYELPVAGRVRSVDALYGNSAMSWYSTLTAVSESPVAEDVLWVGSDDGVISITEDGGETWRSVGSLPGAPTSAFVNDIEASLHDAAGAFVVVDAHKEGDFTPYVYQSNDHGRTWRSIAGDLPDGTIIWAIEQDHELPELLFAGTEFGLYFTPNGGVNWHQLGAGVPTIPFRDVKLQRRDNDVVAASFGRGFYVLDDYSALRSMSAGALDEEGALFSVRDAAWYVPNVPMQAPGKPTLGTTDYTAPNPDFGALFTYYVGTEPTTAEGARTAEESDLQEQGADIPFPGYDQLASESLEGPPKVVLQVRDAEGSTVRRIDGPATAGLHRVSWDLRLQAPDPISLAQPSFVPPWVGEPRGPLAPPGTYSVEAVLVSGEGVRVLRGSPSFSVVSVGNGASSTDFGAATDFQRETGDLLRRARGAAGEIARTRDRLRHMRVALSRTPGADLDLERRLDELARQLQSLATRLQGDPIRGRLNEPSAPSILGRAGQIAGGHWGTRQAPTATQRRSYVIANQDFGALSSELSVLLEQELVELEAEMEAAGAPWTPGRRIPGG